MKRLRRQLGLDEVDVGELRAALVQRRDRLVGLVPDVDQDESAQPSRLEARADVAAP